MPSGAGTWSGCGPGSASWPSELLDECEQAQADGGSFDVLADYAEPLPVLVIAELLGWPEADQHLLRPWSQAIVKMYEVDRTAEQELEARTASAEFAAYVERARGGSPGQARRTTW